MIKKHFFARFVITTFLILLMSTIIYAATTGIDFNTSTLITQQSTFLDNLNRDDSIGGYYAYVKFIPTENSIYSINTPTSSYIELYDSTYVLLSENSSNLGTLSYPLTPGQTYYIYIEDYDSPNTTLNITGGGLQPPTTTPTVTTNPVTSITTTEATVSGEVVSNGGTAITERGIEYKRNAVSEPYTKVLASSLGEGPYSVQLTGLEPNTTYDVKAYATNAEGTSYGGISYFTTSPITASIAADMSMTEDQLDARSIEVTLDGTTFIDNTLDIGNFTLENAPTGMSIESIDYIDATHSIIHLAYDGTDFDSDITNIGVTIGGAELTSGTPLTSSNQLTITANNDPESIIISDDGSIEEGAEDGEVITVTLSGGEFAPIITPANWSVSNLPTGVSKGAITRINDTTVTIALSGNATVDYDTDITNITVIITLDEYIDSTGAISLTANTGVTLTAQTAPTVATNASVTSITTTEAIVNGNVFSNGGTTITERGIEYKRSGVAEPYTKVPASTTGLGIYSVNLTGLEPSTTYDVRAYATNAEGTSYGIIESFTTSPITASIAADMSMTEDQLDVRSIEVTLDGTTFMDNTLDIGSFTLENAPIGMSIERIDYIDATHSTIHLAYDGTDFDSDITNIGVTIGGAELTSGNPLTSSNQLTITANNDPESITISDDGSIEEGAEDGEVITVTLSGGEFASTITPANWVVTNLPPGVNVGAITRVNDTTVAIALSGNSTVDYDTDITNITVSITLDEYIDSTGAISLTANTGVTLTAQTAPTVVTNASVTSITSTGATVSGEVLSNGGTAITERGIEYKRTGVAEPYTKVLASTTGLGIYSVNLTGLDSNTTYDVRAYATNAEGTSYGIIKSFTTVPKSTNADLANLTLSSGTLNPTFARDTVSYTATVVNSVTSITVTPTLEDHKATVLVTGGDSLTVGDNTVTINVTAEDGVTTKTYTINVERQRAISRRTTSSDSEDSGLEDVIVNGEVDQAATAEITDENGETNIVVTIDDEKIQSRLEEESSNSTVTIPVEGDFNTVSGELNGQTVKNMELKQATLEIKTSNASYTLPASQINIDHITKQIGENIALKDIKVQIEISKPTADKVNVVENSAKKGEFTIVAPPLDFNIKSTYKDKTIEVSQFNNYVERTIAIPKGVDPNRITTGIVIDSSGAVRHVPTEVIIVDGKYYAKINSLTNSVYSVIYHPIEFTDITNHWAKDAINDMGSRMVISGVGNNLFEPNRDITRAEFATIVVRALGLKPGDGESSFDDVNPTDWYNGYIMTANEYGIITGYGDGKFRPMNKITREQAMVMIARAMKITGLNAELNSEENNITNYNDFDSAANWSKASIEDCVKAQIISGKTSSILAPKDNITRAEVAVIIKRLLEKSSLI